MSNKFLEVKQENGVMLVTLNRPKALNALNRDMISEIDELVTRVKDDDDVLVIIFTGEGQKAFCAGADLIELQDLSITDAKKVVSKGQSVFRKIELLEKPTIAAINGYALGGGLELALACTFRFASNNAQMAFPEVKLGMIPGYGGTQRLPRLIPKGKALQLLVTGRRIKADEAEKVGLVDQVVGEEELLTTVYRFAEEILENSPLAVSHVLQAVERGLDLPMDQALALETVLDAISISSEEQREGVTAFIEKRKPNFLKIKERQS